MEYKEDDFLAISGIQHFHFCRRQWALIHVERQWAENLYTVDGALMHQHVHEKDFKEHRASRIITRGMSVFSATLGISGECDALEFQRCEDGISLPNESGLWRPYPIEYKRGSGKSIDADSLQLCAQAMCLEEMLLCRIDEGALYYGETHHRTVIPLSEELRQSVRTICQEMHELYQRGYTPNVKPQKHCNTCSLKELCLPQLLRQKRVDTYLNHALEELV